VAYYSVIIGQSVSNCGAGNNETTKTTLGGTFELEHSFSVETTTGASLGMIGPSVSSSTTIKTGTAEKITKSQQIEVNIPPGQRVRVQCWGRSGLALMVVYSGCPCRQYFVRKDTRRHQS
jgi:hypothetical protein